MGVGAWATSRGAHRHLPRGLPTVQHDVLEALIQSTWTTAAEQTAERAREDIARAADRHRTPCLGYRLCSARRRETRRVSRDRRLRHGRDLASRAAQWKVHVDGAATLRVDRHVARSAFANAGAAVRPYVRHGDLLVSVLRPTSRPRYVPSDNRLMATIRESHSNGSLGPYPSSAYVHLHATHGWLKRRLQVPSLYVRG